MAIHQTAYFVVRDDSLEICKKAILEFVEHVRVNEPDTLLYVSLQEKENSYSFLHYFIFRDENARDLHANSEAVKRFTNTLYPNLIAPVEFTEYIQFTVTKPT
jgi:quinol monooxygenase YgiN